MGVEKQYSRDEVGTGNHGKKELLRVESDFKRVLATRRLRGPWRRQGEDQHVRMGVWATHTQLPPRVTAQQALPVQTTDQQLHML